MWWWNIKLQQDGYQGKLASLSVCCDKICVPVIFLKYMFIIMSSIRRCGLEIKAQCFHDSQQLQVWFHDSTLVVFGSRRQPSAEVKVNQDNSFNRMSGLYFSPHRVTSFTISHPFYSGVGVRTLWQRWQCKKSHVNVSFEAFVSLFQDFDCDRSIVTILAKAVTLWGVSYNRQNVNFRKSTWSSFPLDSFSS